MYSMQDTTLMQWQVYSTMGLQNVQELTAALKACVFAPGCRRYQQLAPASPFTSASALACQDETPCHQL